MASKINWAQIGQDFAQKYQGTWCRYVSPITKQREVFELMAVLPNPSAAPSVGLYNPRHGEIHLDYCTEAELDFTFPPLQNFQHKNRAMRFVRKHERQYKKGICTATAEIIFPYADIVGSFYPELNHETLESAFKPLSLVSINQGLKILESPTYVSIVLSPNLSLGVGNKPNEYWLWFQGDPIGVVEGNRIQLKVMAFKQEVEDYLRATGDYARTVV